MADIEEMEKIEGICSTCIEDTILVRFGHDLYDFDICLNCLNRAIKFLEPIKGEYYE